MTSRAQEKIEGAPLGTPSTPRPSLNDLDTRTFLLTVSVPGDISPDCTKAITKHIRARTIHAYCVTELGESDRLHLHAVLIYKDNMMARKIRENVWDRFVKPYHPDAKGSIAVKVQVCPGHDWYDTYLKKETGVTVLIDTYDRDKITDFFPTQATQEALMTKAAVSRQAAPHITRDTDLWAESKFENTPEGALSYLKHRMYVLRDMVPISDKRKLCDKAFMYYEYRNGITKPTPDETRRLAQHHAVFDFVAP